MMKIKITVYFVTTFCLCVGAAEPRLCPKGHYCPPKTQDYANFPCPGGTFTEEQGATGRQ